MESRQNYKTLDGERFKSILSSLKIASEGEVLDLYISPINKKTSFSFMLSFVEQFYKGQLLQVVLRKNIAYVSHREGTQTTETVFNFYDNGILISYPENPKTKHLLCLES